MIERHSDIIENLKQFKELSSDEGQHIQLLKEKKIILYVATLLDKDNLSIIRLCLDILENFICNEKCHYALLSTFGVYESVEALSIRLRNKDENIYKRAHDITEILRNSAPPAFNTRSKKRGDSRKSNVYLLFLEGLNEARRLDLEKALVKIRGIISFLIDMEMGRVTIRICPNVTIKEIAGKIQSKCSMKPLVVVRDIHEGLETFCDVLHESNLNRSYLEYPEEEYQPRGKELTWSSKNFTKKGTDIFKSVVGFWNESFYW